MSRRVCSLAVLLWALLAAPSHALLPRQVFGIGNTIEFTAPRLQALRPHATRLITPWDVALHRNAERVRVDTWYRLALAAGLDPLLSFQGRLGTTPTPAGFRKAFTAALRRWPRVGEWQTWNEGNHPSQPVTWRHPRRAARYAKVMERACPRCTILPITIILSDQAPTQLWLKRWLDEYGKTPSIWAVHDYGDVNRGGSSRIRHFIHRHPKGRIWVTETGAFATYEGGWPYSLKRQKRYTPLVFSHAVKYASRIDRIYWWEWRGRFKPRQARWDTGLVDALGRPRPAYFAALKVRFRRH